MRTEKRKGRGMFVFICIRKIKSSSTLREAESVSMKKRQGMIHITPKWYSRIYWQISQ